MRQLLKLKEIREERGLTQAELAEKAGCSQPMIAAYEANRVYPQVDRLVALANALNVSVAELIVQPAVGQTRLC